MPANFFSGVPCSFCVKKEHGAPANFSGGVSCSFCVKKEHGTPANLFFWRSVLFCIKKEHGTPANFFLAFHAPNSAYGLLGRKGKGAIPLIPFP